MSQVNLDKKDMYVALLMVLVIIIKASMTIGFFTEGIHNPIAYGGGDADMTFAVFKAISEGNWVFVIDRLGAPYNAEWIDFSNIMLQNIDFFIIKVLSLFISDLVVLINVSYVLTHVLCGISAYLVLRILGIRKILSLAAALLFAFSPFMCWRNINHYCLSNYFFVPVSIYLVYVAALVKDVNLKIDHTLINKYNLVLVIACFCVANNGISYYPFFTCFFIFISIICRYFKDKKLSDCILGMKLICLITGFMLLALAPSLVYNAIHGSNYVAHRALAEQEIYSLKITQMFIPTFDHGFEPLRRFIMSYNSSAPLVNENVTSYLGIVSCIGFLITILVSFGCKITEDKDKIIAVMSKMNLAAVLCMSVGGFTGLFFILSHTFLLRGYNRISIFIMFISLLVLCKVVQFYLERCEHSLNRYAIYSCVVIVTLFGVYEQTPSFISKGDSLRYSGNLYYSDHRFVENIEKQLKYGDMVYQLPYHKYPEMGPVNNMADYNLIHGYIHSNNLKWSYGASKGREADKWNEKVVKLPMEERIETIISAGFRGIYIDKRAYLEDELAELTTSIEKIIDTKPMEDDNKMLLFYNLYPFIDKHQELLDKGRPSVEDLKYVPYTLGEKIDFFNQHNTAQHYIDKGFSESEEWGTWTDGNEAVMCFKLNDILPNERIKLIMDIYAVFNGNQNIEIICDNKTVFSENMTSGKIIEIDTVIENPEKIELHIKCPDAKSPNELGIGRDKRRLALGIKSVTMRKMPVSNF